MDKYSIKVVFAKFLNRMYKQIHKNMLCLNSEIILITYIRLRV